MTNPIIENKKRQRRNQTHHKMRTMEDLAAFEKDLEQHYEEVKRLHAEAKAYIRNNPPILPVGTCIADYQAKGYSYKLFSHKDFVFPSPKIPGKLTRTRHIGSNANPDLIQAIHQIEQLELYKAKQRTRKLLAQHRRAIAKLLRHLRLQLASGKPYERYVDSHKQIVNVLIDYCNTRYGRIT